MKNKAELTTQQIVLIVILLLSFSVILFLLFRLNFQDISEKQICHNSVVLKGQPTSLLSSIDCKTTYICISGGDECVDFLPIKTLEVNLNSPNAKNETMEIIANEMSDCWWMFGEGKVDYSSYGYSCAICSVLKFDNSIQQLDLTYKDLYEYLRDAKKSESQTYLQYLYGINTFELFLEINQVKDFNFDSALFSEESVSVLTGIKDKENPIYPYLISSQDISSKLKPSCDNNFVTKY